MKDFARIKKITLWQTFREEVTVQFLEGKKTYITAVLLVVVSGAKAQGFIDDNTFLAIMGVLNGLGLGFMRKAVS